MTNIRSGIRLTFSHHRELGNPTDTVDKKHLGNPTLSDAVCPLVNNTGAKFSILSNFADIALPAFCSTFGLVALDD